MDTLFPFAELCQGNNVFQMTSITGAMSGYVLNTSSLWEVFIFWRRLWYYGNDNPNGTGSQGAGGCPEAIQSFK